MGDLYPLSTVAADVAVEMNRLERGLDFDIKPVHDLAAKIKEELIDGYIFPSAFSSLAKFFKEDKPMKYANDVNLELVLWYNELKTFDPSRYVPGTRDYYVEASNMFCDPGFGGGLEKRYAAVTQPQILI